MEKDKMQQVTEIPPISRKEYVMPTKAIVGRGAFGDLFSLSKVLSSEKIVLICGGHFKKSDSFINLVNRLGSKLLIYPSSVRKSTFLEINNFSEFCRKQDPDVVLAIGGGSILDTGKCGAVLCENEGNVEDFVKEKTRSIKKKGRVFIAIPTTAGTGSEVTPWATVWGDDDKKYSLTDPLMFPDVAIVDSALTDSLSKAVTAETGIDALSQAIEAYWNVKHNPVSDEFALKAIEIIMGNLAEAVNNPTEKSRDEMSYASLVSGLAFSNTQTTICHSVSYPMTAHWGISHGQAVSVTLPKFIEYTLPVLEPARRKSLLRAIGSKNEKDASLKVRQLMKEVGLKTSLSELGIPKDGVRLIVSEGHHPDRAKNAPRVPTADELEKLLSSIY